PAGSRILVQKSIYKNFVEAMTEKAKKIKLGPPLDRETKMGPLVSREQYDRVNSYIAIGKKEAKLASGGEGCSRSPTHLAHPLKDERAVLVHALGPSLQRSRQDRSEPRRLSRTNSATGTSVNSAPLRRIERPVPKNRFFTNCCVRVDPPRMRPPSISPSAAISIASQSNP